MLKIVIDTNILVSGLRSKNGASFQILSQIGTDAFQMVISVPLVMEYEATLKDQTALSNNDISDFLNYICATAIHQPIFFLWRPFLKDPKDDHVLELAFATNADYLVTYNKKDFKLAHTLGIQVIDAKELLFMLNKTNI
jgi:putative PIN family toxin of toxin-antitoxin system